MSTTAMNPEPSTPPLSQMRLEAVARPARAGFSGGGPSMVTRACRVGCELPSFLAWASFYRDAVRTMRAPQVVLNLIVTPSCRSFLLFGISERGAPWAFLVAWPLSNRRCDSPAHPDYLGRVSFVGSVPSLPRATPLSRSWLRNKCNGGQRRADPADNRARPWRE